MPSWNASTRPSGTTITNENPKDQRDSAGCLQADAIELGQHQDGRNLHPAADARYLYGAPEGDETKQDYDVRNPSPAVAGNARQTQQNDAAIITIRSSCKSPAAL